MRVRHGTNEFGNSVVRFEFKRDDPRAAVIMFLADRAKHATRDFDTGFIEKHEPDVASVEELERLVMDLIPPQTREKIVNDWAESVKKMRSEQAAHDAADLLSGLIPGLGQMVGKSGFDPMTIVERITKAMGRGAT